MRTRTLMLLSIMLTAAVVAAALLVRGPRDVVHPEAAPSSARSPAVRALVLLRAWDERRATAWAHDDAAALRALYVPGSSTGRRDVAMLAAYHRRGLRVTMMQRQLLTVRVRVRSAWVLSLLVTDRLAEGRVVGHGRRAALPRSGPATHRIVLRRLDAGWRVAEVYDA